MRTDLLNQDTIAALATPPGTGAIAVIRLSGQNVFELFSPLFSTEKGRFLDFGLINSHSIHLGYISDGSQQLDQVLVSVFKGPHSYTGQNTLEVSCHGSRYIQQQLLELFIRVGARLAEPGEFTLRAFLNKKMDLVQAEAVADLIASTTSTSHQNALLQMRGGFSSKLSVLRTNLVDFAALIELELDFSEEDVEFANRSDLRNLVEKIHKVILKLIDSFHLGNVIKNGIQVAIVGRPNAGKSTLLNQLLEEDRAIVSEIPGTTRDTIEDEVSIDGILFRFVDTAGIRTTADEIEQMGVIRTFEKINNSTIVIYLFDIHELTNTSLQQELDQLKTGLGEQSKLLVVGNKIDKEDLAYTKREFAAFADLLFISAKEGFNIDQLRKRLVQLFDEMTTNVSETVVTNVRHVQSLNNAASALERVIEALENKKTGEWVAFELKDALHHLGLITGEVTGEEVLGSIFSKFCIGK